MSLTESLMTFLEEQDEKEFVPAVPEDGSMTEEEIADRFKIQTKEQANYYVRKFKEIQLAESEIEETAKKELERLMQHVTEWKEKELQKLQYPKAFFSGLLQDYAASQLEDAKKKTLNLPNGSVGFKKQQPEYKYDDDILKNVLSETKYATYETITKINKSALKKDISVVDGHAYIEGKLIEGVEVYERDPKFEIK